jgi:uncharacterized MAPEG superfamily protein
LSAVAGRLQRAQYNLFETLPLFIGAILIAHIAGRDSEITAWGAQIYFWGRVVYVPLYWIGVRTLRSLVWTVATIGLLMVMYACVWPM